MGLVISGLQRARVLAALQVRGGMCSHPHRHQVRSGCSLSPFYGGQQRAREGKPLPSLPAKAWHNWDSPRTPGLCSLAARCWATPARGCVHMCAVRCSSQRKPGLLGGQPLLCPHFPQVGGCVGDPGSGHSSRQVDSRDWLVLWSPASLLLRRVGVCDGAGGRGGETVLCSEWFLGEHTVPLRTLNGINLSTFSCFRFYILSGRGRHV